MSNDMHTLPFTTTTTTTTTTATITTSNVSDSYGTKVDWLCIWPTCNQNSYDVVALHIDYGNRDESEREAHFVEEWCRGLGIIFHKRTIREVTRGVTARDDYERISREIRFEFYTKVCGPKGKGPCDTAFWLIMTTTTTTTTTTTR